MVVLIVIVLQNVRTVSREYAINAMMVMSFCMVVAELHVLNPPTMTMENVKIVLFLVKTVPLKVSAFYVLVGRLSIMVYVFKYVQMAQFNHQQQMNV